MDDDALQRLVIEDRRVDEAGDLRLATDDLLRLGLHAGEDGIVLGEGDDVALGGGDHETFRWTAVVHDARSFSPDPWI